MDEPTQALGALERGRFLFHFELVVAVQAAKLEHWHPSSFALQAIDVAPYYTGKGGQKHVSEQGKQHGEDDVQAYQYKHRAGKGAEKAFPPGKGKKPVPVGECSEAE